MGAPHPVFAAVIPEAQRASREELVNTANELFRIEKGQIRRIEAVFHRCPYGLNSGWSTYEQGMSDQIQSIR
jgi:hypothetical protein